MAQDFCIDGATARQRLTGRGLAMMGKGRGKKMESLQKFFSTYNIKSWLITPTPPSLMPSRARSVSQSDKNLSISTDSDELHINETSHCLILLADISGQSIARQIQRASAQRLYRGKDDIALTNDNELCRQILLSRPVLDIYLLDNNLRITTGARLVPGRYNPQGLGKKMTGSASQNLLTVMKIAKKLSSTCIVDLNFGFSRLPGCAVRPTPEIKNERETTLQHNLRSLTRYGWLLADIARQNTQTVHEQLPTDKSAQIGILPVVDKIITSATAADKNSTSNQELFERPTIPRLQGLPTPPEPPVRHFNFNTQTVIKMLVPFGTMGLFFALISTGNTTLIHIFGKAMNSGILAAGVALFLTWGGFYYLRLRRHMANTPTSKIRSLAMGMVEIHGQATRKYALISPMSQTPCVYYRLRKYRRGSKNRWILKSDKNSGHVPFSINDGTGTIEVNPTGADVHASVKNEGRPDSYMETGWISLDSGSAQKWVEEVVPEGADLYVLGFARPLHAKHKSIKERTVAALRELKLNRSKMQHFDANDDGQIDATEWEAARTHTEQEVLHQMLAEKKQQPATQQAQIGRPGARGLPFVIAEAASEAKLTRKFGWLAGLLFGGAALAASWTLYRIILVL